jgi:predicted ATPase
VLFEKIEELNSIEGSETVNSISDLLLFKRHFSLNSQVYSPSNGESSMVLLHNELRTDKEIYIIDEPEKSLGNDYISDVIVPLLKERARLGRKIIIATHDANIAVRTLPYNSIYRKHDLNGYLTYTGNPFSNSLICKKKDNPNLDWKEISMKTLEGGKEAFGERGKIYGNT